MTRVNVCRKEGFTLLEIIVVLAVIAILAALVFPSLSEWQRNARLKASTREVYGVLQKARSEAVKRNRDVTVQFTTGAGPAGRITLLDISGGEIARVTMPAGIELTDAGFFATTFNSRGLSSEEGDLCVTDRRRYYRVILSGAGVVRMEPVDDCP